MTTEEKQAAADQEAAQYEMKYREEVKYYAAMMLSGIKGNSSRASNSKKDIDYVKECVKMSMLLVNYVGQIPLNFRQTAEKKPITVPKPENNTNVEKPQSKENTENTPG